VVAFILSYKMKKLLLGLIVLLLFVSCQPDRTSGLAGQPSQSPPAPSAQTKTESTINAILFSWDGTSRDRIKEGLERKELPNLQQIINEGSLWDIDLYKGHNTATKPGHTVMLTGYGPDVTGVFSNAKFQPIPEGYTIFERLQVHFGKDNITVGMVTGKTHHVGGAAPYSGVPTTGKHKAKKKPAKTEKPREIPGEPFYLTKSHLNFFDSNAADADVVGPKMLNYIEKYKDQRFFFFFHFSDPDSKGHKFGDKSPERRQAIIKCDEWTGKVMQKLKDLNLYQKTVIYVTADHGFDDGEKTHKNAPYVFLSTNNKKVTHGGNAWDTPATILKRFGVDIEKITPPLGGKPLYEK